MREPRSSERLVSTPLPAKCRFRCAPRSPGRASASRCKLQLSASLNRGILLHNTDCVSQTAKAAAKAQQDATTNAAKACWAERKPDPAAFKAKYGTNANKSNAFGKCVSSKVKHTP